MKHADIDWSTLGFGYVPTDYNVRCYFRDGKWGEIEISSSETIEMHIAATALHYGQECFEGLKAFRGKDGKVRVFRPLENARRIQDSARGILMEPLPTEKFVEMMELVIKLNERFIPPYGSGASLYIRPLEIGMTARVGVKPAEEYCFIMLVSCSATASASCANAVMGSVEKQRINASNMLNTRFFIAFYLFPMGIVIPIILKITYHTFSQRNQGLHESTQICHESTEEDFKWLNAVQ